MVKTRIAFADELKLNANEIWNDILSHEFINEISMDTLPLNAESIARFGRNDIIIITLY